MGKVQLEDAAKDCRQATLILKALGSVLALWPPLLRGMERRVVPSVGQLRLTHHWRWDANKSLWRCIQCISPIKKRPALNPERALD